MDEAAAGRAEPLRRLREQIRRLLWQGRYEEAAAAAREALRLEPGDQLSWKRLGQSLVQQNEFAAAAAAFAKAAVLDPNDPDAPAGHGRALAAQGHASEAEVAFRQAIEIDPRVASFHDHLGRALAALQRDAEAEPEFREAIRLDPTRAGYHTSLGRALVAQDRYPEAEKAFRDSIELDQEGLDPDAARCRAGLGRALAEQDRPAEAEAEFREAVRIQPGWAQHHADLGRVLQGQGRYREAERQFAAAVRLAPGRAEFHSDLGQVLRIRSGPAEAHLRRAADLAPGNHAFQADLGDLLLQHGKFAEAEKRYRDAMRLAPENLAYPIALGRALSGKAQYPEAQALVAQMPPQDPRSAAELAGRLAVEGRHGAAQRLFRFALRHDRDNPAYHAGLGRSQLAEGEHEAAERSLAEAVRLDQDNAAWHADLGRARLARQHLSAAESALRDAVRLDRDNAAYLGDLGRLLRAQGRLQESIETLRRAVRLDAGSADYQASLGQVCEEAGQAAESETAWREAVRINSLSPDHQAGLGWALSRAGKLAEAEAAFRAAVQFDPANPDFHAALGGVLLDQHKQDEAEASFGAAVQIAPALPGYRAGHGLILIRRGQLAQAQDVLDEMPASVQSSPDRLVSRLRAEIEKELDRQATDWIVGLAGQFTPADLRRKEIPAQAWDRDVARITADELPRFRAAYREWAAAQRKEEPAQRRRQRKARRWRLAAAGNAVLLFLVGGAGLAYAYGNRHLTGRPRDDAVIACLAAAVLSACLQGLLIRKARRTEPALSPAVQVLEDQLKALAASLIIEPALAAAQGTSYQDALSDQVTFRDNFDFSMKAESDHLVATPAYSRLVIALGRRNGAAVAVAGPRGSGKSELARAMTKLQAFGLPGRAILLLLQAPAECDAAAFIRRLLKELCTKITDGPGGPAEYEVRPPWAGWRWLSARGLAGLVLVGLGLAAPVARVAGVPAGTFMPFAIGGVLALAGVALILADSDRGLRPDRKSQFSHQVLRRAAELRRRLEFSEQEERHHQAGLVGYGLRLASGQSSTMERVPLSEVDVKREFGELVEFLSRDSWRVVIAIDELDKMSSDHDVLRFLDHIRDLFQIHNCSFMVSVSEELLARYEARGLLPRDATDSSFHGSVHLEMLSLAESRGLLRRRISNISDSQALLCHCLAGGRPRSLLRAALDLAQAASQLDRANEPGSALLRDVLPVLLSSGLDNGLEAAHKQEEAAGDRVPEPDAIDWAVLWPDAAKTEQQLRECCPGPGLARSGSPATQPGLTVFVGVLHTVRQAFSPGGPLSRLAQASSAPERARIEEGFDHIARAQERLTSSEKGAWALLHRARELLGLPALTGPASSGQQPDVRLRPRRSPDEAEEAAAPAEDGA